jgi:hypothetical protein
LSVPVIAHTACADFRFAPGRFAGCAYRPRRLPGAAGWRARGRLMPVRRRISPVPHSAVQTFRSPCAGGFLGAAYPSSSPRPWPSPLSQGLGSPLSPWVSRDLLRRCRIHLTLRTACLLDPRRVFVVALRRRGSLLAPATSYTAAWSLPWPDSHRRVECSFQDARERAGFMCRTAPAVSRGWGTPGHPVSAVVDVRRRRRSTYCSLPATLASDLTLPRIRAVAFEKHALTPIGAVGAGFHFGGVPAAPASGSTAKLPSGSISIAVPPGSRPTARST